MATQADHVFEIDFYEAISKRNPKDPIVLELLGGLYSNTGQDAKTLRVDRRLAKLQPNNPRAHYNLACSLSVLGKYGDSMDSLRRAIELGYDDVEWMTQDPDLEPLKNDPLFDTLINVAGSAAK